MKRACFTNIIDYDNSDMRVPYDLKKNNYYRMKLSERIPKAIVVVAVVGFGALHNLKDNNLVMQPLRSMQAEISQSLVKEDSVHTSGNRIVTYTKSFINSSIQHIISNL